MTDKDLGIVTAYGYAVEKGYTGTEEEFAALMADYAAVGQRAEQSAAQAAASATAASGSAGDSAASATAAEGFAGNASTAAGNAAQAASQAAQSATQAAGSATTAGTAATNAQAAQTAAETAQTAAENAADDAETAAASVAGKAAQIDQNTEDISLVKSQLEAKANTDGYYSDMTVGNAEQLVATVGIEDQVPYIYRTSGGTADIGDREVDMLVGGTVAWNQLIQNGNFADTTGWEGTNATVSASDGVATIIGTGNYARLTLSRSAMPTIVSGHKYYITATMKKNTAVSNCKSLNFKIGNSTFSSDWSDKVNQWETFNRLVISGSDPTSNYFHFADIQQAYSAGYEAQIKDVMLIDLTQMFGSTIADYIYSLETATPGTGVAWFKKLFPKDYYAYDAGSLQSVQAASHEMTGFNQWDEEWEEGGYASTSGAKSNYSNSIRCKNLIPVVPNNIYYVKNDASTWYTNFYDANGVWIRYDSMHSGNATVSIPDGVYFITFWNYGYGTTYHNNICINLSWDGSRNGEYEPYELHSYPLDSDLVLRGIPKLNADNKLYYDGDVYQSDGTVTRRYGVVDLGTLEWIRVAPSEYSANAYARVELPSKANGGGLICATYSQYMFSSLAEFGNYAPNMSCGGSLSNKYIAVRNDDCATSAAYKTAMSGVYLVYELATPTTETAEPFQNPQIVDDFGTEEYTDAAVAANTRDVAIPVGHDTYYQANLVAKLEMAPDSPDGEGDYIVRQTGGTNEYVPLEKEVPAAPSADGTYTLKVTVASGTPTLSWVADS